MEYEIKLEETNIYVIKIQSNSPKNAVKQAREFLSNSEDKDRFKIKLLNENMQIEYMHEVI